MLEEETLTEAIIGAAIEVHRHLGPGLLESAYQHCIAHELTLRGISFRREVDLPIVYKGSVLNVGYRMDFVIEEKVIFESKSAAKLIPINEAQLLTHMKLSGFRIGLLVNFNSVVLRDSIVRRVL